MSEPMIDLKHTANTTRAKGLWRLTAGYRLPYLFAVIAVGLAALAQASMFSLISYFVDDVLPRPDVLQRLPFVAAAIVGAALVQGLFSFLSGRMAARTAEGVVRTLRDYLYDHMQRLTFSYHDKMQTGELLQRATSDVDTLRRLFAEQAIGIGRIVLIFIVNFAAIILINDRLALMSIVILPFVILSSLFFFRIIGKRYEAFQEQQAVLTNRLQENLTGVRVVKAFARQAYEREKFEVENHAKFISGTKLTNAHATFWPSTDILCGLQTVLGMYVGATMVMAGTITLGQLLAYTGFLGQLIWPIRNLGRLIADLSTGLVSFGRNQQIIIVDREPAHLGLRPEEAPKGDIVFNHVDFVYEGEDVTVLHDVSFSAEAGQSVALLGATGSGKTSLVNLIPRFYNYTGGSVTLDGVELNSYSPSYLRKHIGIVQQEPFLFAASIFDNIAYGVGREVSQAEVEAAATAAAVHDVIQTFPAGYGTLVGEKGVTLSGGQKQRITLARTLLQNPRILILDAATSAVDSETESQIRDALNEQMQDRTTFIIAHRVQSVMHADVILVFDEGRIIQRGTHTELLQDKDGIYHRIYDLQASIESELEAEIEEAKQAKKLALSN